MTSKIRNPAKVFKILLFCGVMNIACSNASTKLNRVRRQQTTCPVNCRCFVVDKVHKQVQCFNAGQIDIPRDVPGDVRSLNLSRNDIQKIKNGKLDNFRFLENLDLSHNSISEIDSSAFQDLESLLYLDISYNKISNASVNVLRESSRWLQVLNISATSMQNVPELRDPAGVYMTNLTHLSMGSNFYTQIPPHYLPRSLKYLDMSCLRIRNLPNTALTGLNNLEKLDLHGCAGQRVKLTGMDPAALSGSPNLKWLDLSNNQFAIIPHDLPNSLIELDLSNNMITSLKHGVCATQEQLRLSFFGEGSSSVGSSLSHLIHLTKLDLHGNRISTICVDDFVGMEELLEVNLTNCRLHTFHRQAFLYAPSLHTLDLSHNLLNSFRTEELAMVENLYVSYNYITSVQNFNKRTFPSLLNADFSGNPYRCDCDLKSFVSFLAFSGGVRFRRLHAYSTHYACAVPTTMKGKPLLTVNFDNELDCSEDGGINISAIAAPISLVGFIVLIVLFAAVYRCQTQKKGENGNSNGCCWWCCCKSENQNQQMNKKVVVSQAQKYNAGSDILIQQNAFLNDAAILCHVNDHKWVINKMVPQIHAHREKAQNSNKRSSSVSMEFSSRRKLNMEVFTIAESIKIDNLNKCVDSNRKIVVVVTLEFIKEGSCLFLLTALREKMKFDPKDAVVLIILDAIPWATMPTHLQNLMVEKTFVQVPQNGSQKQETTFWNNLCSYIGSMTARVSSKVQVDQNNDAPPPLPPKTISGHNPDNFAPARRAGQDNGGIISTSQTSVGETREERLRRLGLTENGEIAQTNSYDMMMRQQMMARGQAHPISPNLSDRDIDRLYSLKSQPPKVVYGGTTGGHIRSLLPAHADDVDSVYSEDEEVMAGYEVRPQYRADTGPRHPSNNQPQQVGTNGYSHQPVTPQRSYVSKASNSQEFLHGTNKSGQASISRMSSMATSQGHFNDGMDMSNEPEPIPVADESTAEENEEDNTSQNKTKKKKKFKNFFKKK